MSLASFSIVLGTATAAGWLDAIAVSQAPLNTLLGKRSLFGPQGVEHLIDFGSNLDCFVGSPNRLGQF